MKSIYILIFEGEPTAAFSRRPSRAQLQLVLDQCGDDSKLITDILAGRDYQFELIKNIPFYKTSLANWR